MQPIGIFAISSESPTSLITSSTFSAIPSLRYRDVIVYTSGYQAAVLENYTQPSAKFPLIKRINILIIVKNLSFLRLFKSRSNFRSVRFPAS